ncbi:MAG: DOPA 4,5-dioxygenase family protein [Rhodospirillales bacterium]
MPQPPADPRGIVGYHAHIYYNKRTKPVAARIRAEIEQRFDVVMGRWHDAPVGPHPVSMYQVAFATELFPKIVPWLMLNRDGLNVLVHPETDSAYHDHKDNAMWLGRKLPLFLDKLPRGR